MPEGKAEKTRSLFRMSCTVTNRINAPADRIWALLTDAPGMPTWNSTVTSITGAIRAGEKLAIRVPISERTFKVKVTTFEPNRLMVWSDGHAPMFTGVRAYTLTPNDDGTTTFSMEEVFRGVMLPMIKGSLPDFGPVFEQYAADLKGAAEAG